MIPDEAWKAVAQIAILLGVLGTLWSSHLNRREAKKTAKAIQVVHDSVNGKMEQLLAAKGAESRAEGEASGREKAIAERQERVVEAERVEDRADEKAQKG